MLSEIVESIRQELTETNTQRDQALQQSRALVRSCANAIRAIHRHEWEHASDLLTAARAEANLMTTPLAAYPALYHAGYTQDALKELVEAHVVYALVRGEALPTPERLNVTGATYLRGLSEAATEMRRFVLDLMRQNQVLEAQPYLEAMDEIYSHLLTIDFPDSITDGLRRLTDVLRGVLERTRGDLTLAIRQDQMRDALRSFESRLGADLGPLLDIETGADERGADESGADEDERGA
ncbi:MAG: haloacid dehalogenase [Caldilineaceae bacterium]|nr:haloacid dehalogenase [Caldilineaceae bacterium]